LFQKGDANEFHVQKAVIGFAPMVSSLQGWRDSFFSTPLQCRCNPTKVKVCLSNRYTNDLIGVFASGIQRPVPF
jgi:hypothetical protein